MVFGGCSHAHTVKLTDTVNPNNGFFVCGKCSKDTDFADGFRMERMQ